jgi:hypothetical protein
VRDSLSASVMSVSVQYVVVIGPSVDQE